MAEQPNEVPRRADDVTASVLFGRISEFLDRSKKAILGGAAVFGAFLGLSSYLGAQLGTPKRVDNLEARHVAESTLVKHQVDGLIAAVDSMRALWRADQALRGEQIEVLLRIGCPTVRRADLVQSCRPYTRPRSQ